jgi:hypothetical protein
MPRAVGSRAAARNSGWSEASDAVTATEVYRLA